MKSGKPRVIVITGAAAGVGRASAQMFAKTEGKYIGLIARGREALEGARHDVEVLGGKTLIIPCDITDAEGIEAAAERVEQELGPIDVWVNVNVIDLSSEKLSSCETLQFAFHWADAERWEGKNFEIKVR